MLAEGQDVKAGTVFVTKNGTYLGKSNLIRQVFKPLLKKAGVPTIRFHDLRHTHASILLAHGESIKAVSSRLGHSDVAPLRKTDPGELFDWPRLARAGVGLWPDFTTLPPPAAAIADVQRQLAAIGYDTPRSGAEDDQTAQVIAAFQRHFRPALCDGKADRETRQRIAALAAALPTS